MIPKSGNRFPAFAKPASAGEARSEKIMLKQKARVEVFVPLRPTLFD
jgi:hypothetical protein